jgi:HNH endonuclease
MRQRNESGQFIITDVMERFFSFVVPEPNTGCWLWLGSLQEKGYPLFSVGKSKCRRAHVWSFKTFVGAIPQGLELDHKCRLKSCVNPQHLEPVTHIINIRRHTNLRTHCKQGHPFIHQTKTRRVCRVCDAERGRRKRKLIRDMANIAIRHGEDRRPR